MKRAVKICVSIILLGGLPLLGVFLAGEPLDRYLEFPPTTRYVDHAAFSWTAFVGVFFFVASVTIPFLVVILEAPKLPRVYLVQMRSFPWWGWLGITWLGLAWVLAWSRLPWVGVLQPHTFTPLWLGYIVVVNAVTFQRTSHCLLRDRTGYFLALFPLSALFWWFFEYLNRFVQNWYYIGVTEFSALEYFLYATLPFSTVLPAVLSTIECLESFPSLDRAFRDLWMIELKHAAALGWACLLLSCASLTAIAIWPNVLFPLVWISPFLIIISLQAVLGEETILSGLTRGDWRPVWLPALAGLTCGFFWELWNSHSLAHWEYAVPYVHRFQLFEMPLLGYAGYLPFGLECVVVAQLLSPRKEVTGKSI